MGHKIVTAIIENGRIEGLDEALPSGKLRVHLIYDTEDEVQQKREAVKVLAETSGIYTDINGDREAKILRDQWERDLQG